MKTPFALAVAALLAACVTPVNQTAAPAPAPPSDPRVGLRAGWMHAGEAVSGMRVVSKTPPPPQFIDTTSPGDFKFINSDLAFTRHYAIQGNFSGYQVWDIADPAHPALVTAYVCPGAQNDVSVYRNLLFVSGEALNGRIDCGTQGIQDTVSKDRLLGIRIFDITDIVHPRYVANVQTCRGSHTHTVVNDPADTSNVYIYVSGSAPPRSPNELPGCSGAPLDQDSSSALFRLEVIQVPLAAPERAHIVTSPRVFAGLTAPPEHGESADDIAQAAQTAAVARSLGAFTAKVHGLEIVLPSRFTRPLLDSIMKARGGTGAPTGADSATLRTSVQGIVDRIVNPAPAHGGVRPGPTQCHDITVYSAIGLAGGACAGYGLLLDIRAVTHPKRIAAVSDSNFSFWHSATFNNDGSKVLFTDEWGGGLQARCRATDKPEWGADAIFTRSGDALTFQGYYKLPAPQTPEENCVAHNGSLIPVPGRDVMVQGWYQGGVSVFDWTDPKHVVEIAYFDRGPMDSTKLVGAGSWSAYWYNGYIVSSEIARGLDILELVPSRFLSQNEIDAAKLVRFDYLNAQNQPKLVWPPSILVARAYLDQLERSNGMPAARIAGVRTALADAERMEGGARRDALTAVAGQLDLDAATAADPAKAKLLAAAVRNLAAAQH